MDVMYTGLCDVMYTGHGCDVYWAMDVAMDVMYTGLCDVMYTGPWMWPWM